MNITILTRHLVGVTYYTGVSSVTNAGISVTTSVTLRHLVQLAVLSHQANSDQAELPVAGNYDV